MDQHALMAENQRLQLQNMRQELQSQLNQQQQQQQQQPMMMMPNIQQMSGKGKGFGFQRDNSCRDCGGFGHWAGSTLCPKVQEAMAKHC